METGYQLKSARGAVFLLASSESGVFNLKRSTNSANAVFSLVCCNGNNGPGDGTSPYLPGVCLPQEMVRAQVTGSGRMDPAHPVQGRLPGNMEMAVDPGAPGPWSKVHGQKPEPVAGLDVGAIDD